MSDHATPAMPMMRFGSTGHISSRLIFGAAALFHGNPDRGWTILDRAIEVGINHLDTAASYGDAELNMAPWLAEHRSKVFLATKTGTRDGVGARAELELSLERLGVDHVDLIQLHNLVEPDEWEQAHGPGGVVEAMAQAQAEGLCSHIGVTGHGLRIAHMHLRSLEQFPFASVLVPFNYVLWQNADYRADLEALFNYCNEHDVAVQTIKSVARRRWVDQPDQMRSWYEPLTDTAAIRSSVHWVLQNPQVFVNTTSDGELLEAVYAAAVDPQPVGDGEMDAVVGANGMLPLFDGRELERI